MKSIIPILSLVCTATAAGIVGTHYVSAATDATEGVVAFAGTAVTPDIDPVVTSTIERPVWRTFVAAPEETVTESEIEAAKERWHEMLAEARETLAERAEEPQKKPYRQASTPKRRAAAASGRYGSAGLRDRRPMTERTRFFRAGGGRGYSLNRSRGAYRSSSTRYGYYRRGR